MAHEDHKRFLVEQKINSIINKKSNEVFTMKTSRTSIVKQ